MGSDAPRRRRHAFPWKDLLCVAVPVCVYLCFTAPALHLPGPYTDELFFAPSAMEMAGYELPQEYKQDIGLYEWNLFGKPLPVMALLYLGMVRAYFHAAVFRVAGPSVVSLRGFHLLLGALGIAFTFLFTRLLFRSRTAGLLAGLFLAFDPTYVFSTRMDSVGFSLSMMLRAAGSVLLLLWWRDGSVRFLYAAVFLVGLSLSDKAVALWFWAALAGAAILVAPRGCLRAQRRSGRKSLLLAAVFAAAGGLFFVVWFGPRFAEFFGTWILGSFSTQARPAEGLVAGLHDALLSFAHLAFATFSGHLRSEIVQVRQMGGGLFRLGCSLIPAFFLFPLCFLLWAGLSRSTFLRVAGKRVLFLWLAGGLVLLQILVLPLLESPFDLALDYHHLLVSFPLFHAAAAGVLGTLLAGLVRGFRPAGERRRGTRVDGGEAGRHEVTGGGAERSPSIMRRGRAATLACLVLIVLAVPFAWNGFRILEVNRALRETGGIGMWSDSVYRLVSYLEDRGDVPVLCADWGINRPLLFLSQGRIRTVSPYRRYVGTPGDGEDDPAYLAWLEDLFREPELLIVEHAEPWVAFQGAQRAVEKVVRETGRTLRPEAEFGPAGAGPVYRVSSLVPAPGPGPGRDGE